MGFYEDMQGVAQDLLAPTNLGKSLIIRHTIPGTYDPVTDTQDAGVVEDYFANGVLVGFKKDETLGGVIPQAGDMKAIFSMESGETYEPIPGDYIVGLTDYRIEGVEIVKPIETPTILIKCLVRPLNA